MALAWRLIAPPKPYIRIRRHFLRCQFLTQKVFPVLSEDNDLAPPTESFKNASIREDHRGHSVSDCCRDTGLRVLSSDILRADSKFGVAEADSPYPINPSLCGSRHLGANSLADRANSYAPQSFRINPGCYCNHLDDRRIRLGETRLRRTPAPLHN